MGSRHQTLYECPTCETHSYTRFDGIVDIGIEEVTKIADNIIYGKRKFIHPHQVSLKGLVAIIVPGFDHNILSSTAR
jgi:hypothetical protein